MQRIQAFARNTNPKPSVCTIGSFDGVHLGHQQLIRTLVSEAHAHHAQAVVITFHPHPREVLGNIKMKYLTTPAEQAEQMQLLGVDTLLVLPFTKETSQTPAEKFVEQMITHLNLISLWIGPDFAMGYKRQGNAGFLKAQGQHKGFAVNVLPELGFGHNPISSTRVREALARGDVREANLCLGRPFSVTALVQDEALLCIDAQHALPANGHYEVLVQAEPNEAEVRATCIHLRDPISQTSGTVKLEFV
ncbi:MAG: FAD synthetase family protein [Anaerolineae bacterium]|nr:FAD synthetase family protein [Anaerolineae bacterium]